MGSNSLVFPRPAGPRPETRPAGYKPKGVIQRLFPSNVATMLLRIWNPADLTYTVIYRHMTTYTRYMTPYPMPCHMGSYTEYIEVYTFPECLY